MKHKPPSREIKDKMDYMSRRRQLRARVATKGPRYLLITAPIDKTKDKYTEIIEPLSEAELEEQMEIGFKRENR